MHDVFSFWLWAGVERVLCMMERSGAKAFYRHLPHGAGFIYAGFNSSDDPFDGFGMQWDPDCYEDAPRDSVSGLRRTPRMRLHGS